MQSSWFSAFRSKRVETSVGLKLEGRAKGVEYSNIAELEMLSFG